MQRDQLQTLMLPIVTSFSSKGEDTPDYDMLQGNLKGSFTQANLHSIFLEFIREQVLVCRMPCPESMHGYAVYITVLSYSTKTECMFTVHEKALRGAYKMHE